METVVKQTPTSSSEIVKLIRKLRWVGLEEKAERLEKELEQHAVIDTVVSIQNESSAPARRAVTREPFCPTLPRHLRHGRAQRQGARGDSAGSFASDSGSTSTWDRAPRDRGHAWS